MKYQFADRQNYADFASGAVFLSSPGYPAFPVRLASEIFQRGLAIGRKAGLSVPCRLYDPCCGSGYLLSVLAHLHREQIARLIASDIDPEALRLAEGNLALTTLAGMRARRSEIEAMLAAYGKPSHLAALASAKRLEGRLAAVGQTHPLASQVFAADATRQADIATKLQAGQVDMVITDIPYGRQSNWQVTESTPLRSKGSLWLMLEALLGVLAPEAVVVLSADKRQRVTHAGYQPVKRLKHGKRQIVFLRPL